MVAFSLGCFGLKTGFCVVGIILNTRAVINSKLRRLFVKNG